MRRRERVHLAILIGVGALVIGWGIWRIPPHQLNGDEWSSIGKSLLMLFHEPVMPRFRKGGNFHLRLVSMATLPLVVYWYLTGRLGTMNEGTAVYASDVPLDAGPVLDGFYQTVLVGRLVSVVAAIGTVYLVYRLGAEVADRRAGFIAGLVLLAAPGFVTVSKFATEDAPQFFLVTLTLYLLVRGVGTGDGRKLMLAAVMTGLAVSMKATSGFLVLPVALAMYAVERREDRTLRHLLESASLYSTLAAIGYFSTTPSALVYPREWLLSIAAYIGLSVTDAPVTSGHTYQDPGVLVAGAHYFQSLGGLLAIVSLIALAALVWGVATRRYDRRLVLVLAFGIPYALVLFTPRMPQYPRLILLHPVAAVAIGVVAAGVSGYDPRIAALRNFLAGWGIGFIVAIILISLVSTGLYVADFGTTRADATDWLEANVEPGEQVDVHGYRVYQPEPPAGAVIDRPLLNDPTDTTGVERATRRVANRCPRFVVMSSYYYGRFFNQPGKFPEATALTRRLLGGETAYERVARFGPPVIRDYSLSAKVRRSFNYPPRWLWGTANPTVVILERQGEPTTAC